MRAFRSFLCLAAAMVAGGAFAEEAAKPLQVLYVTGGCCHDYEAQKAIISKGLESRARIKVTVVHEGGDSKDHKVSIYTKPDWSKGYDVVFHNECWGDQQDPAFVSSIVAEHAKGTPAVMMHCAMHTFRKVAHDDWRKLCGVTSLKHDKHYAYTAKVVAEHPVVRGLPKEWQLPKDELYFIDKLWPTATSLAEGMSVERQAMQSVIWVNQYEKARVFGTTIGHYNETVELPAFLDLVTRGTLWAAGKLQDDGTPAAGLALAPGEAAAASGWAATVTLPEAERGRSTRLFNGRDFEGWEGRIDPYWSIDNGEIVGKNTAANAPQASTYLLTKKPYRNFRLLCEGKLAESEMHTGVAIWGRKFEKDGEASSYQGHLVMFPTDYGVFDLFRREGVCGDQQGRSKAACRPHDWNQLEILAIGNRIRFAVNGKEVMDWTDPKPELCASGPIGLQLHSNTVPQEVRFRGLVVVEDPQDVLVTATPTP